MILGLRKVWAPLILEFRPSQIPRPVIFYYFELQCINLSLDLKSHGNEPLFSIGFEVDPLPGWLADLLEEVLP